MLYGRIGLEAEVELPFPALHQLLHPVLDHLSALPPRGVGRRRPTSVSPSRQVLGVT
jgi:hypothetical protein